MASKSRLFRTGKKQVFLPDHVVSLLRPKENQSPNFASFRVPLRFNKLDLRDYLLNVYNVPVLGVRSQLIQRRPDESEVHGRIVRPRPLKTMTVELRQPFVWPELPEDKDAWKPPHAVKRHEMGETMRGRNEESRLLGTFPIREVHGADEGRKALSKEARKFLNGNETWSNDKNIDPKFRRTERKAKNEDKK